MASTSFGDNGVLTVRVSGLSELVRNMERTNRDGLDIVNGAIEASGKTVLASARSHASAFAASGAFRATLDIKKMKYGIVLQSTDEAAGVIEFAKHGAVYRPKVTDKRPNARKMPSFPVGVPRGAVQPRSMVPAVNENAVMIANRVAEALERALNGNS